MTVDTPRSAEEILALWKKRPNIERVPTPDEALRNIVATIQFYDVFEPKLEAFIENVDKALQSKDLAYKTMEKGYLRLSKDSVSRAELQKLIEEFPKKKPIYDVWDENNPDHFDYEKDEVDELKRRLGAVLQK